MSAQSEKTIHTEYVFGDTLGKGAFSEVKLGTCKKTANKYAIKIVDIHNLKAAEAKRLRREIEIMKKLEHPHIVRLVETYEEPGKIYLVLEMVTGGELFDALVNRGTFTEEEASNITRQILQAIHYCHEQGIAHRDLKPENLLLVGQEEVQGKKFKDYIKVVDFGLSKDFSAETMKTAVGSQEYAAPEILMGEAYDKEVDIWSIGVITYVLLCGYWPFHGKSMAETIENVTLARYYFPDEEWKNVSAEAKDFIKKIFVVDPKKRPTADELLTHPWIKGNTLLVKNRGSDLGKSLDFNTSKFQDYIKRKKN